MLKGLTLSVLCALSLTGVAKANTDLLSKAIDGKHRTEAYAQRDVYRNPLKTLSLFDIQPSHTVVEVWPGGGWYTEILAPYLKDKGQLIAAHYDANDKQADYRPGSRKGFEKKMAANKTIYGDVKISSLMFDQKNKTLVIPAAKANSVDRIVTFRSAHGLVGDGVLDVALGHFFDILKSGGKLGLVQHQADEDQDFLSRNIGYVGRSYLVSAALKAGFKLEAEGYFNNNPLDTKRHPSSVWSLPPSLENFKSEAEKVPYKAIGESDRMTLVFVKP